MKKKWEKIIKIIGDKTIEIHTYPKIKKQPLWFTVSTDGKNIYINEAKENSPSSKLKTERVLNLEEFIKIYPIYLRREDGENVTQEAVEITYNSVYYYAIIKYILEE